MGMTWWLAFSFKLSVIYGVKTLTIALERCPIESIMKENSKNNSATEVRI